jgi:hypothetical protein
MTDVATTPEAVLKQDGVTLTAVLRAALRPGGDAPIKPTPLPKSVAVTPEVAQILKTVAVTLDGVTLPTLRRELDADELEDFTLALEDVTKARTALEAAEKKLKLTFQTHFDAVARNTPGFTTNGVEYNKDGFYVTEDHVSAAVEGLGKKVIRSVVPGSPVLTEEGLASLEAEGVISHEEYLKATQQVRVVDEDGVMELAKERPELLPELASETTQEKADYTTIRLVTND